MKIVHCLILLPGLLCRPALSINQTTAPPMSPVLSIPFESDPNRTFVYEELIDAYRLLARTYPEKFRLQEAGPTDSGLPLHCAVISESGIFDPARARESGKAVVFINNGIHPGEPEGIDATVMLLRDLLVDPSRMKALQDLILVVIPVYNVGGCLNRNANSRANQNGPESYGFRGNARNFDLNRDFIKADSRNAQSFHALFRRWDPLVFVDNHTSNGADYQYTMTLIATQHDKLEAPLGAYLRDKMAPELYREMQDAGWAMTPYVDGPGPTPESGIHGFCDYGRYSTGYAAMWQCIGFMPETHMLKPFADRLWSTYRFMEIVLAHTAMNREEMLRAKTEAVRNARTRKSFVLDWALDESRPETLVFKGYESGYKPSAVSGLPRLYYDRSKPYERVIPYFPHFKPALSVEKPYAYIIPREWSEVIERLALNGVEMKTLQEEVSLPVTNCYIRDYKTREAWEGHYFHYRTEVDTVRAVRVFHKGDRVVFPDQAGNHYIVGTLEPQAPDSWFAWNFFEPVLMQKEYFSAYVFEDLAAQFLAENPEVAQTLKALQESDPEFAQSARRQLDWVYRRSPWYEPSHRRHPVARVEEPVALPLE